MKITNAIFAISIAGCLQCFAMTENNFASVTNDWYHGAYTNVLLLAQHREAQNSNDVVAAYVMYEWNKILGTKESFSNAIEQVLCVSDRMTDTVFKLEYMRTKPGLVRMRDEIIPLASESQVRADWSKAKYSGKVFSKWRILKILWDQRLW